MIHANLLIALVASALFVCVITGKESPEGHKKPVLATATRAEIELSCREMPIPPYEQREQFEATRDLCNECCQRAKYQGKIIHIASRRPAIDRCQCEHIPTIRANIHDNRELKREAKQQKKKQVAEQAANSCPSISASISDTNVQLKASDQECGKCCAEHGHKKHVWTRAQSSNTLKQCTCVATTTSKFGGLVSRFF